MTTPSVVVPVGPAADGRQVRSGFGLGEHLTPDVVPAEESGEVAVTLVVGAVDQQGRGAHPVPDHEDPQRQVVGGRLLVEDDLMAVGQPLPSESLGERERAESGVEEQIETAPGPRDPFVVRGVVGPRPPVVVAPPLLSRRVGLEESPDPGPELVVGRFGGHAQNREPNPPVHQNGLAGDPFRLVARQVADHAEQILGAAHALDGGAVDHLLDGRLG